LELSQYFFCKGEKDERLPAGFAADTWWPTSEGRRAV
jgi:hypothetical protein